METIEFLKEHCEFKDIYDCYVLLAVSRKKDVPEITNSKEVVFREVLRKTEDIERKVKRLKLNCENYRNEDGKKYPFYIYVTCNARDGKRAARSVMGKLMDCFYEESLGNERSRIFKRIDREFISHLMKPKSRSKNTKYFMIDIDTKDEDFVFIVKSYLKGKYIIRETRHGYHIKSEPFNIQEFNSNFTKEELNKLVSVQIDRLMFVDYIKNE